MSGVNGFDVKYAQARALELSQPVWDTFWACPMCCLYVEMAVAPWKRQHGVCTTCPCAWGQAAHGSRVAGVRCAPCAWAAARAHPYAPAAEAAALTPAHALCYEPLMCYLKSARLKNGRSPELFVDES